MKQYNLKNQNFVSFIKKNKLKNKLIIFIIEFVNSFAGNSHKLIHYFIFLIYLNKKQSSLI